MEKGHKRFEELPVWRAGRELVRAVYEHTRRAPFSRDFGLCDQIQRAAVSITSNIAEGHERGSTADLIQFLFYAKGSAGETRSQLYNAEDLGYIDPSQAERLREAASEISRQLSAWIQSMQTLSFKQGPRFHKEQDQSGRDFIAKLGFKMTPKGAVKITEDEKLTEDRKTENGKKGGSEHR
ncbi:MAG TPA: four helix bundle protein [Verrucomicrobia bacterium]|nr:four helix bundle protein [Verrucomicrobiota bacterium]